MNNIVEKNFYDIVLTNVKKEYIDYLADKMIANSDFLLSYVHGNSNFYREQIETAKELKRGVGDRITIPIAQLHYLCRDALFEQIVKNAELV